MRADKRPATASAPMAETDAIRAVTRGHTPLSSDVVDSATKKSPKPRPAPSASRNARESARRQPPPPPSDDTSDTASSATAIQSTTSGHGRCPAPTQPGEVSWDAREGTRGVYRGVD